MPRAITVPLARGGRLHGVESPRAIKEERAHAARRSERRRSLHLVPNNTPALRFRSSLRNTRLAGNGTRGPRSCSRWLFDRGGRHDREPSRRRRDRDVDDLARHRPPLRCGPRFLFCCGFARHVTVASRRRRQRRRTLALVPWVIWRRAWRVHAMGLDRWLRQSHRHERPTRKASCLS